VDGRRCATHPRARARVPSRRIAQPDRRPVGHEDTFTRAIPFLTLVFVVEVMNALDVNAGWANLLLGLGGRWCCSEDSDC
jgi:hypothetical protein